MADIVSRKQEERVTDVSESERRILFLSKEENERGKTIDRAHSLRVGA